MSEMVRMSKDTDNRITTLSIQLDIPKNATISFLLDSFEGSVKREVYRSIGRVEIKVKPLNGKRLKKVCIQKGTTPLV